MTSPITPRTPGDTIRSRIDALTETLRAHLKAEQPEQARQRLIDTLDTSHTVRVRIGKSAQAAPAETAGPAN